MCTFETRANWKGLMTSEILLNIWNAGVTKTRPVQVEGAISEAGSREIYELNRHRLYSLAFWMTGNELRAEGLLERAFVRAFARNTAPTAGALDAALLSEIERLHPFRKLSLRCVPAQAVLSVRKTAKRVELEEAVLKLPSCERLIFLLHDVEGYSFERIARLLWMEEGEVRTGLHQARLRMRELLASVAVLAAA